MQQDVERVFREEWSSAVAILTRVLGDLELAEDAVQDAFATALERWPREGPPDRRHCKEPRERDPARQGVPAQGRARTPPGSRRRE
jgi:hypothetical protein